MRVRRLPNHQLRRANEKPVPLSRIDSTNEKSRGIFILIFIAEIYARKKESLSSELKSVSVIFTVTHWMLQQNFVSVVYERNCR